MGYYRRQFWLRMADPHRWQAQNHPGRACPGSASGVPLTADRGAVRFSRHRARRRCQLTMKTDEKIGDMLRSIQSQKQVRMEDTRGGTVAPAIADEYSSSSPSCILGWKLLASRRCVMAMHGIATRTRRSRHAMVRCHVASRRRRVEPPCITYDCLSFVRGGTTAAIRSAHSITFASYYPLP